MTDAPRSNNLPNDLPVVHMGLRKRPPDAYSFAFVETGPGSKSEVFTCTHSGAFLTVLESAVVEYLQSFDFGARIHANVGALLKFFHSPHMQERLRGNGLQHLVFHNVQCADLSRAINLAKSATQGRGTRAPEKNRPLSACEDCPFIPDTPEELAKSNRRLAAMRSRKPSDPATRVWPRRQLLPASGRLVVHVSSKKIPGGKMDKRHAVVMIEVGPGAAPAPVQGIYRGAQWDAISKAILAHIDNHPPGSRLHFNLHMGGEFGEQAVRNLEKHNIPGLSLTRTPSVHLHEAQNIAYEMVKSINATPVATLLD